MFAASFKMPFMTKRHFIKEWRKHRGLNQEQLAERIGVGQPLISKIERDAQSPDLEFLEVAATALSCSVADLVGRDPTDSEAIWALWERMQPTQRDQLVEIAKTLQKVS